MTFAAQASKLNFPRELNLQKAWDTEVIYVLGDAYVSDSERKAIAEAIKNGRREVLEKFHREGKIIHAESGVLRGSYKCLYCLKPVVATKIRGPLKKTVGDNYWHFQHTPGVQRNDRCLGFIRSPEKYNAIDFLNPVYHGCHALFDGGDGPDFTLGPCNCVDYCHLALVKKCEG